MLTKLDPVNVRTCSELRAAAILLAVLFTGATSPVWAANRTWVGLDVDDNKWNSTANWSGSTVPVQGDSVYFDGSTAEDCLVNVNPAELKSWHIASSYTGTIRMTDSAGTEQTTTNTRIIRLGQKVAGASCCNDASDPGVFDQDGGTFKAPKFFYINAFDKSGGTFTHNSGTVVLKTNAEAGNRTLTMNSGSFHNLAINDGLLGYWRLDETGTLGNINDHSGNQLDLTARNSPTSYTTTTVKSLFYNPGSIAFVKSNARALTYGSLPNALKPTLWTVSAWVRVTTLDTNGSEVVSGGNRYMLRLIAGTGTNVRVQTIMYDGSDYDAKATTADNNTIATGDNKWHHVVAVNDGTKLWAWVDGTAASFTLSGETQSYSSATDDFVIGAHAAYATTTTYEMDGYIDDVRVFDRALTDTEILALFAGGQAGTSSWTQTLAQSITAANDVYIGAGTLNDGGHTINVGAAWYNSGGLFASTGTVIMTATGTEAINSNYQWFNNLTFNGAGTFVNKDVLHVAGTLTIQNGTFQPQANDERYKARLGTVIQTGGTYDQQSMGGTMISSSTASNTFTVTSTSATLNQFRFEAKGESNLVGYWKLDEQTGSTTYDTTSSGNTGTLVGGVRWWNTVSDHGGTSSSIGNFPQFFLNTGWVDLDGTDDYITLGTTNLPVANATKSISLWVYYDASTAAQQNFFSIVDATAANNVQVGFHNSTIAVWKAGATDIVTAAIPAAAAWRHVVYTYELSGATHTHKLYIDGVLSDTETGIAPDGAGSGPYYATIGAYRQNGGSYAQFFDGKVDDVRVYNVVLTAQQVRSMAAGRYAGTGSIVTWTLGGNLSVPSFAIDAGTLSTSNRTITTTGNCNVSGGIWNVGAAIMTCGGNSTIYDTGKVILNASSIWKMADTKILTIDGTLESLVPSGTKPIIQNNGTGSYLFKVGSASTSTPTLNINGLEVKNTDTTTGMWVNATAGAQTVVTRFDNITFSGGDTESGTALVRVDNASDSFYMNGNGNTFDRTGMHATSYNVMIKGDSDPADGEARATFGNSTCKTTAGAAESCEVADLDDDTTTVDGLADSGCGATAGCGVVQFIYNSYSDTAGSIAGFPTPAFNWTTFAYWMTYVAFNNVSSGVHRLYARAADGSDAGYSWDIPSGKGTFVGGPRWDMEGSDHYVYIVTSLGYVYKIRDFGSSGAGGFSTVGGTHFYWNGGSATATSPLALGSVNAYWSGNDSAGNPKLFAIVRATGASAATPQTLGAAATGAPALTDVDNVSTIFCAAATGGSIYKKPYTLSGGISTAPGAAAIGGPIGLWGAAGLIYGDGAGVLRARTLSGLGSMWSYTNANASAITSVYYNLRRQRVFYGDAVGKMYAIIRTGTTSGGEVLSSNYPYQPTNSTTASDPIQVAPVYVEGVTAYGTTTGKVVFVDAQNASNQPAMIQMYHFGSAVSSIGYEYISATVGNFMVATANGKLHLIRRDTADATTMRDPTSGNP